MATGRGCAIGGEGSGQTQRAPPLTAFSRQLTVCFLLCLVLVPTTLISEYFFTIIEKVSLLEDVLGRSRRP